MRNVPADAISNGGDLDIAHVQLSGIEMLPDDKWRGERGQLRADIELKPPSGDVNQSESANFIRRHGWFSVMSTVLVLLFGQFWL